MLPDFGSCLGGYSGYFGKKRGINVAVLRQIELPHFPDTWVTPHQQLNCVYRLLCFYVGVFGHNRLPTGVEIGVNIDISVSISL